MEVEQLRREAAMKRIPVSQAVDDIKVITINISTKIGFKYKSVSSGRVIKNWLIKLYFSNIIVSYIKLECKYMFGC
jgi:hypothetical protein